MLTLLDRWKQSVTNITNVIIGRTAVQLTKKCYSSECNLGNLIADSFVYYVKLFEYKNYILLKRTIFLECYEKKCF